MAELKFNTPAGNTVERKMLILYLNTGTSDVPTWSPVGRRVEESSMEFDWGREDTKDIFGNTYTKYNPPVITQTFEPCDLDSADAALQKIWNQAIKNHDTGAMSNNDLLVVHTYITVEESKVYAERYPSSAIEPSSLGGSATVAMPITVTYGGQREQGAAEITDDGVVFTKRVV